MSASPTSSSRWVRVAAMALAPNRDQRAAQQEWPELEVPSGVDDLGRMAVAPPATALGHDRDRPRPPRAELDR